MSHCQIPPALPTVEDAMDYVALTPYNHPESAFNFEGWQEEPWYALPSLLLRYLLQAANALSTQSSPRAVLHSVPLQFEP